MFGAIGFGTLGKNATVQVSLHQSRMVAERIFHAHINQKTLCSELIWVDGHRALRARRYDVVLYGHTFLLSVFLLHLPGS